MTRTQNSIRTICEIGLFAAIGFVLDELQGILSKGLFINGGSIGFAMIAVLIIGFRRGWLPAILTGLIMGLFDIASSAYILNPMQMILDYIIPYAMVGLGCLVRPLYLKAQEKHVKIFYLVIATAIGGVAKLLCHYFAGVFFWADPANFAWGLDWMNPWLYCFIYNIAFILPSVILSAVLISIMYISAPHMFKANATIIENEVSKPKISYLPFVYSGLLTAGGLVTFVLFFIKYITSFKAYEDGGAIGYDFDPDATILFILGAFLAVLGVFSLYRAFKHNYSYLLTSSLGLVLVTISLIYGISRLIRCYVKEKDPAVYWLWLYVGLFLVAFFVALVVLSVVKKKIDQEQEEEMID